MDDTYMLKIEKMPKVEVPPEIKTRKEVMALAYEAAVPGIDPISKTHSFYCAIGRGIKGLGDEPALAFSAFEEKLRVTISEAPVSELEKWKHDLERDANRRKRLEKRDAIQDTCTGQIGLSMPAGLKDALLKEGSGQSFNEICSNILAFQSHNFDLELENGPIPDIKGVFDKAMPKFGPKGSKTYAWSQRLPVDLHATLIFLAHECSVSLPQLCRYLILKSVIG
jgi:hypothetical protein